MHSLSESFQQFFAIGINKPSTISYQLIPDDTNIKLATLGLELSAASSANPAVGVAVTKTFKYTLHEDKAPVLSAHVIRVKVGVNENVTATLTGGDTYRINAQVLKNGVAVTTKQNGQTRTTGTAIANTLATHAMQFEVPATLFSSSDTYDVLVEVEVQTINRGTGSITYTLNYDPNTTDKQLFVELDY